ncbi:MAG: peptide ABC transporter substrate-binding protein [Actinomycetia bacterium]|nr:peptide ABC transporter substrate-binding protein [Actinomycetes bacterium]
MKKEEETLTLIYWQAPSTLNPYLSGGYKDRDAGAITLEPLAKYDPGGSLIPALAAEIPTLQNGGVSPDLTSITWKLRDALRWSDGSSLTAHDAVFTWRYCIQEATGCTATSAFSDVTSVEALDDLTVRVTFREAALYPYTAFVGAGVPVLSRGQFAECVGAAAAGCLEENHAPLGSGPYRVVAFTPDQKAVYERNPHYYGETPYFDRVVLQGGGDAVSAAAAVLEHGKADYAWNLQIDPGALARMEAMGKGKVVSAFSSLVERIVLNQTNPDPALGADRSEYLDGANPHPFLTFTPIVRAMSMAIDRRSLSETLYGFAGKPTCNLIAGPPDYVSTANDECLSRDIEGASKLLDDSGVLDTDGDGIREYNDVPLRITFQTSTNDVRQETQSRVRDWWRQIGIETELVHHDAAVFFGGDPVSDSEVYSRFFADVQMYATGPDIDPQQYLFGLTCVEVPDRDNNWGGSNVPRACDPKFDALVKEISHTPIGPERAALVKRMNDILVQSYYEIPLVNRGAVSAHVDTLRGVRINGWDSELWNIAEWRR